jgi:hypothetical protein
MKIIKGTKENNPFMTMMKIKGMLPKNLNRKRGQNKNH